MGFGRLVLLNLAYTWSGGENGVGNGLGRGDGGGFGVGRGWVEEGFGDFITTEQHFACSELKFGTTASVL